MTSPIEVAGVSKSFVIPSGRRETVREHALDLFRPRPRERLQVLDDVSFELRRGESLGLMGRNGSGKSTLLKIVSGIYQADAGRVEVRTAVTPILELGVGWNPDLDAIDNIELLGTVMGLSLRELRQATTSILEFAGLERFAHLELRHYSSGMAARLAYAVAFRAVRDVLILDEIFAVGDAEFKERCQARYRQLHRGRPFHAPRQPRPAHDRLVLRPRASSRRRPHRPRRARTGGRRLLSVDPSRVAAAGWGRDRRDMTTPRISVLLPCFNHGAFIDEAVESVFAQTFQDFEIIVVDDGSTDAPTVEKLSSWTVPRLRVLRTGNRGLPAARNHAARHASGAVFCALDADDRLAPTWFEKALAVLDRAAFGCIRVALARDVRGRTVDVDARAM